jgi:hypothetical protein
MNAEPAALTEPAPAPPRTNAPWRHRTHWRRWVDGVLRSYVTEADAIAAAPMPAPAPPGRRRYPRPADAPHIQGTWWSARDGVWFAVWQTDGKAFRERCESQAAARQVYLTHRPERAPAPAPTPRRAARSEQAPVAEPPTDESTVDDDADREPGLQAFASGVLLMTPPPPDVPMPPGWKFDPMEGRRRPMRPGEIIAEPERQAAPAPRRLSASEIAQLSRELGPRTISPAARAFRRSRRAKAT